MVGFIVLAANFHCQGETGGRIIFLLFNKNVFVCEEIAFYLRLNIYVLDDDFVIEIGFQYVFKTCFLFPCKRKVSYVYVKEWEKNDYCSNRTLTNKY